LVDDRKTTRLFLEQGAAVSRAEIRGIKLREYCTKSNRRSYIQKRERESGGGAAVRTVRRGLTGASILKREFGSSV
jgi:hypothetical protein